MAISNQRLQFLLSRTEQFQTRVRIALCTVALQVLAETGVGSTHTKRAAYATSVINNPGSASESASVVLSQSTNVKNTITMEDEGPRSSVTDAALESQISTLWNALAGVDAGN